MVYRRVLVRLMYDEWVEFSDASFEGCFAMDCREALYVEHLIADSDGKPSEIYARTGPYFEGTSGKSAPLKPV